MATVQDIGRRIRSIQNTRKITRAMELVAGARLRRAQQRIEAMRPYADRMLELMAGTARASSSQRALPLLQRRDVQRVAIVPLTGDRGLAGAFNAQILRRALQLERRLRGEGKEIVWAAIGKKGAGALRFRRYETVATWQGFTDKPAYADARNIAQDLIAAYTDGDLDRVEIVYNGYISPMQQNVRREILLPLQQAEFFGEEGDEEEEGEEDGEEEGGRDDPNAMDQERSLWIYEPSPGDILKRLAPDFVEISIYRALLESTAAEHGARMTAMRSASDNAEEMIEDLSLEANRQRQAEITQELMEVVAGAEALS